MRLLFPVLAIIMPLALARAPLHTRGDAEVVPNSYIVALKAEMSPSKAKSYYKSLETISSKKLAGAGYRGVTNTFDSIEYNAFHLECDENTLEAIRDHPAVESVYQDGYVYGQITIPAPGIQPRDEQVTSGTWGLGRISHRDAGVLNYVNEKALRTYLYCLDTGVKITHTEFGGRAIWGANFIDNSPCATAAGNVVGVDNTTTPIAVKCLDKNSSGSWSGVMAAIDWGKCVCSFSAPHYIWSRFFGRPMPQPECNEADHLNRTAVGDAKARNVITRSVINMSIGGPTFQPLDDMVANATASGMTIVVAASNYGADASTYSPARAPGAITVAAIDRSDTRPSWSNYGKSVALFAPGVDVNSAWLTGDSAYATLSGTSMAAPHVAGLATYLMSREGLVGPAAVKQRMLKLATSGLVQNANGSPNLIAFNGAEDSWKY
ncbi:putative Peptidase S8/S53 domain-containing protein [Seiridium unicorne]|uniref:Peptidase S8/S53 domain-containing protein n=1 Tax=Seiridium unicorne TaxID=138068 RepID=A0ABR2ULI5_9PEZI